VALAPSLHLAPLAAPSPQAAAAPSTPSLVAGTFAVTGAPIGFSVKYLVVAGGGGGGNTFYSGGGGGAGGMRTGSMALAAGSYTVTVGAGGNRGSGSTGPTNGLNSVICNGITSNWRRIWRVW
jgi:hypothetical protein